MGAKEKEKLSYEDEVQNVLEESAILDKKIRDLVNRFYVEHEEVDLFSIIDLIYEKGNPRNREFLDHFKKNYKSGELSLKEISRYNDLYDQHKPLLLREKEGNNV